MPTRPFVITFSGIDGAGKTTQIEHLSSSLQKQGFSVLRLTFWDHVAVWSTMRAGVGHRSADFSRAHQMTQRSFAPKNNKHVRKWYLTAVRSGMYVLDVVRLRRLLASPEAKNSDVVIFDRYVYDQIANIYSHSFAARLYARVLLKHSPTPDLAFILDASPTAAFARKPEYPLAFMRLNRRNFLRLHELVPQMVIITDTREEDVRNEIEYHVGRARRLADMSYENEQETGVSLDRSLVKPQPACRTQNEPTASV